MYSQALKINLLVHLLYLCTQDICLCASICSHLAGFKSIFNQRVIFVGLFAYVFRPFSIKFDEATPTQRSRVLILQCLIIHVYGRMDITLTLRLLIWFWGFKGIVPILRKLAFSISFPKIWRGLNSTLDLEVMGDGPCFLLLTVMLGKANCFPALTSF